MGMMLFDFLDILLQLMVFVVIFWSILQSMLMLGVISFDMPRTARMMYVADRLAAIILNPFRRFIKPVLGVDATPVAAVIAIVILHKILKYVLHQEAVVP